ncbi:MAG: hypothetical protein KDE14_01965 [Rhodobacteraceae bacterium]|nr:hypothetical protein [Paracoccaceae bacterium]
MSDLMLVSTRKGLMTYTRNEKGWVHDATHFYGSPVSLALSDKSGQTILAALNLGHFGVKLHRTQDGGKTWTELDPPAYPKADGGESDESAPANKGIWALEWADPQNPNAVWCGTAPGGLFYSDDLGATWTLNRGLWDFEERKKWVGGGTVDPALHSVCVDPRDKNRIAVGVSCGGVNLTEDGGKTWRVASHGMWAAYVPPGAKDDPAVQDVHMIVQSPTNPDIYWCQHHNAMFRSTDASKSWQEIKPVPVSNFGFAVAVHPKDPETAWYVPAHSDQIRAPVDGKVVVNRTRDGGKTFTTLRNGLPQENAFDLIYRHGLAIDRTGERLAMGSTTGGLWATDDQGENWASVSNTLPPVYAVRFA